MQEQKHSQQKNKNKTCVKMFPLTFQCLILFFKDNVIKKKDNRTFELNVRNQQITRYVV